MDTSDLWDWDFMWQMFRNFLAGVSPFVMIVVAIAIVGMLLGVIVGLFWNRRKAG